MQSSIGNRYLSKYHWEEHEISLLHNLISKELQKGFLIDSNNVMTKDASDLLFAAFGVKDMHQAPLVEHELCIVPYLVLDDEKFISKKAARVIEKSLQEREDGSPLKDQEI